MGVVYGNNTIQFNATDAGRIIVSTKQVIQDGLVLNLDAGASTSYVGTGVTWRDLSGNGNTGTLTNGPTYSSVNGGSIVFDGVDDWVNLGNILNFTTQNFSFNIFFYLTTTTTSAVGQGPVLFYKGSFQINGYYISVNQTSPASTSFITNQSGVFQQTISSQSLIVGAWNCISVVRSGSSVAIYINGANATTTAATHINPASSTNDFTLAAYQPQSGGSIFSNIRIAVFQAYNRSLTAAEVSQNFNALRGRFGI